MAELDSSSRTCFVSSSVGADTSFLKHALELKGITPLTVGDIAQIGGSIESLRSVVKSCDFACVLLTDVVPSSNAMLEIGLVLGVGKPILIIATDEGRLPFDLTSLNIVRLKGSSATALDTHLEAFVRTLPRKVSKPKSRKSTSGETDHEWAWNQVSAFRNNLSHRPEFEFERFVGQLFEKWGYSVTAAPGRDFGADMAVWSAELKRKLGNPLLVEVKLKVPDKKTVDAVTGRLTQMIREGQGSVGMLVALEHVAPVSQSASGDAPIVHLSIGELIDYLAEANFLDVLTATRNAFLTRNV